MLKIVEGDLLDQDVEVIVNAWNRNIIPWWLLIPHGVSGAIKRRGGYQPFRELGRLGTIPLGNAVETGAGRLPFKAIIHVAGINMFWYPSEYSIRQSVKNALALAQRREFSSIAFPLIGAGVGSYPPERVMEFMKEEVANSGYSGEVRIVRFAGGQVPQVLPGKDPIIPKAPQVLSRKDSITPQAPHAVPDADSIIPIVISRGILVAPFIFLHDPITIWPLGIMSSIAFIMAVSGKPAAARVRLAKAVVYGTAAIAINHYVSNDQSQPDMLVSKLEEYKRQHGVYPEQLDAMVPALLPAIPKIGLMSFQYRRKEDTNSYWLSYRPSIAGPCSYTPERGKWKCQAR